MMNQGDQRLEVVMLLSTAIWRFHTSAFIMAKKTLIIMTRNCQNTAGD